MVVPKVLSAKDVEKSPSPQPFQEPEGMVSIDLNAESSSKSEDNSEKPKSKKTRTSKICKTVFYLLLFVTIIFAVIVFIDGHTHIFKKRIAKVNAKFRKTNNSTSHIEKLIRSRYKSNQKQQLIKCALTKTFENCCNIFIDGEFPELAEICTVNDVLDLIIITFETDGDDRRIKRNLHPNQNVKPISRESGKILDQYIEGIGNLVSQQLPVIVRDVPEYEYYQHLGEPQELYYDDNDYGRPENNLQNPEHAYYDHLNSNTREAHKNIAPEPQNVVQFASPQNIKEFHGENILKTSRMPLEESLIINGMPHEPQATPFLPDFQELVPPLNQPTTKNFAPVEDPSTYVDNTNVLPTDIKADRTMETTKYIAPVKNEPEQAVTTEVNKHEDNISRNSDFSKFLNNPHNLEDIRKTTDNFSKKISQMHVEQIPSFAPNEDETSTPLLSTQRSGYFETTQQTILDNTDKNSTDIHSETLIESSKQITRPTESETFIFRDNDTLHTRANTQGELIVKPKSDFPVAASEFQSIQQPAFTNQCFFPYQYSYPNPYAAPYKMASPFEGSQVLKIVPMNTERTTQYILNPALYPYMQTPLMQSYPSNFVPPSQQPNTNNPIQVTGPGGQYYICNPIPTPVNNIASLPGVEIRRESDNLQDALENFPTEIKPSNASRESDIICPIGHFACEDGNRCIPKFRVCDNEIHCDDGSDEWYCSCKDRVGRLRICDGYFDCPNGEDELGCFGCTVNEFSCDDWSRFRKSTCIPVHQRCDNIKQCEMTGKDEEDCSVLSDKVGNHPHQKVSNAVGFLHRNYKGKWYPTCFGTEIWAMEVCKAESGPSTIVPRSHMMLTTDNYDGEFINILPNNQISLVKTCVKDRAAFVECPPLFCGLRMTLKNPYRPQEVDTSAEEIMNELERVGKNLNASYVNETSSKESEVLGISRVVGGKPSQPAAWPWLVSIYKNGIFHCGGVLVNELWVVTAAHCVHKYWQNYYEVQAGMLRRFSYSPMEQRRWAVVIIANENYDKSDLKNDIGLMKLSAAIRFNRYVRPICLPSEATAGRTFMEGPLAGSICTTVGWGATVEHGSDPDHMREVEVPVLNHCKHPDDEAGDEICAGLSEGGKDACQGDSGGPFMCRNPNNPSQWYLAGIVSHGEGCARPNEPGVYTKVGKFVGWITENMGEVRMSSFLKLPLQRCPGYICKGTEKCLPKKHHCDKIVDCLFGDDEMNCNFGFNDFFKNSRGNPYLGKFLVINTEDVKNVTNEEITDFRENSSNQTLANNTTALEKNSRNGLNSTTKNTTEDGAETYFKCQKMLQMIPINQRCNKKFDCEDGTDEINCLCVDYIKNYNPAAICDGITDCFDLSDENMCAECNRTTEYQCRQSRTCVDLLKRCDGVADCPKGEDELDCAALTDGATLTLDSDLRPQLATSGIITINRFGVWRPFCANDSADDGPTLDRPSIAANVCNLLGFEEYVEYWPLAVQDRPLMVTAPGHVKGSVTDITDDTSPPNSSSNSSSTRCQGMYVKCSNVSLDSSLHGVYLDNVTSRDVELYTSPWNAVIYAQGIFRCTATILNSNWIVTSVKCFEGITTLDKHYAAALVGKGKSELDVKGPHEQVIRIVKSVPIENTDIILLLLEKDIIFNRYVKHVTLQTRRDGRRKEKCYAVGQYKNRTKLVYMSPIVHCSVRYRCFESTLLEEKCENSVPWSGSIVCDSGSGWYPAAVYSEKSGHCGLAGIKKYTSLKFFKNNISAAMERGPFNMDAPHCHGFRCLLGECLDEKKVCDGIPDCRSAEDEEADLCYEKEVQCHLVQNCVCPLDQLKCKNNKCIPKSSFCDRKRDCEDGEDEPDICSCKNYLELTNPDKICDGVVNCLDRTDEAPSVCQCRPENFKCEMSGLCVPNEVVCDGTMDCPHGEDERVCVAIGGNENQTKNAGEVLSRTGGIWHPGCFLQNHTIEELDELCSRLGFPGTNPNQLTPAHEGNHSVTLRPVIDPFDVVWIHRQQGNKLYLGVRTGNEPRVRFMNDDECFRLFLACM